MWLAQDVTSPVPIEFLLGPLGLLVFLLVVVVWGGRKRWWVFGWQYEEAIQDRDRFREMAIRSVGVSEKATDVVADIAKGSSRSNFREEELYEAIREARARGLIS